MLVQENIFIKKLASSNGRDGKEKVGIEMRLVGWKFQLLSIFHKIHRIPLPSLLLQCRRMHEKLGNLYIFQKKFQLNFQYLIFVQTISFIGSPSPPFGSTRVLPSPFAAGAPQLAIAVGRSES